MVDKVTGVLSLLKGLVKQTPTSKSTELTIPTKAELEKLPQSDLEKISNQLQKATNVDRREFLRGALGTIANTAMDVGTLGQISKMVKPAAKTVVKKLPPNIMNLSSMSSLFNRLADDFANKIIENPYEELMDRGVKESEIDSMNFVEDAINKGIVEDTPDKETISKVADGMAEYEADAAIQSVFKGNSKNLDRYIESGNEKTLISDDYFEVIRELMENYDLNPNQVRQYLKQNGLYKVDKDG